MTNLTLGGGFFLSADFQIWVRLNSPTLKLVVPLHHKYSDAYRTLQNSGQYFRLDHSCNNERSKYQLNNLDGAQKT